MTPDNTSPNRTRRTRIIVWCIASTMFGLAYLNTIPEEEITTINSLTAKALLEAFTAIIAVYVLGSAGGAVLEKFASRRQPKD